MTPAEREALLPAVPFCRVRDVASTGMCAMVGQDPEGFLFPAAQLLAAVAAERERCIAVVRSTPNGCALADNRAYVERFRSALLAELAGARQAVGD